MQNKPITALYIISLLNIHAILNTAAADPALERSHSSSSISDSKIQKTNAALSLASTPERTACSLALNTDNFDWNNHTKQQPLSRSSTPNNSTASPAPSEQQIMKILQNPNLTAQHHRIEIAPSRPTTPIITTDIPQPTEQRQPHTNPLIHVIPDWDKPVNPQPEIAAPKPNIALGIHKVPQTTLLKAPVPHNNHNSQSIIHSNGWDEPVRRQPTRPNNIRATEDDEYENILCGSKCCYTCCCTCVGACCDDENEKICGTHCCYNCCESCLEGCAKNCEPSKKCCCRCMGITFCSPCILAGIGFVCITSPIWGPIACCIYGCSERR